MLTSQQNLQFQLAPDLKICRILNGMWQVSGSHGSIAPQRAIAEMFRYLDAGFTSWDLADHYGPAEDFVGALRRQLLSDDPRRIASPRPTKTPVAVRKSTVVPEMQALTKWVPRLGNMTRPIVAESIGISLRRMSVPVLDLLQFHWWDYRDDRYLDALKHLADLQAEGKIRYLGLTNFDTEHLQIVLDAGIPIVSNQVQFSLIDQRPLVKMAQFCQSRGVHLLAYGTLCGGMFAETYLGKTQLDRFQLNTASLRKYRNIVEAWGGWPLFQELLTVLSGIAKKHQVSIANVAVRYVLDQPAVAGAIVGARLGVSQHIDDNLRVFNFSLDAADLAQIAVVCDRANDLFGYIGDCGEEYRN
jgi:aryl-alcohol dehydrogenase-like predicted oxidoreductase